MDYLTFIGYWLVAYVVTDVVVSLVVFGFLYLFRKNLFFVLRSRLRFLLGIEDIDNRLETVEDEHGSDDEHEDLKPSMKKAIDDEFNL